MINLGFVKQVKFRFCAISLFFNFAYASPIPATSSSALTSPEKGLFFSIKGFQLSSKNTSWLLSEEPLLYKSKTYTGALFSVEQDTLKVDLSLENYAKRWMKDYSQYGFDVLGVKSFAHNKDRGLVIDLLQHKQNKQIRQAIFLSNKDAVVLTCLADQNDFKNILTDCNQMIKGFSWTKPFLVK